MSTGQGQQLDVYMGENKLNKSEKSLSRFDGRTVTPARNRNK